MSTPTPPTPKGPRNPGQQRRKNASPNSYNKTALPTTPPPSPPRGSSPKGTATEDSSNNTSSGTSRKRNGRSAKRSRDFSKPFALPNGTSNHRHTVSQPNFISPSTSKDGPHYAGPTFHASPAPSALPIPSFFSKSVPDSDLPSMEFDSDSPGLDTDIYTTPSKPKVHPSLIEHEHEPSPLDFLFKAAIEARDKLQCSPEVSRAKSSPPYTDPKAYQTLRKPEFSAGGIFSFELGGSEKQIMPIGPSFATPYKDRMNALRSADSPSQSTTPLNEEQRRAKTEALKTLLFNPRPQRPPSALHDQANAPRNRPTVRSSDHFAVPLRTSSGPSTPVPFSTQSRQDLHHEIRNGTNRHISPVSSDGRKIYPPSSALRQELSPSGPINFTNRPAGSPLGRMSAPQTPFRANNSRIPDVMASTQNISGVPITLSRSSRELATKEMEEDLRRILKLDMTGGLRPNGVQA